MSEQTSHCERAVMSAREVAQHLGISVSTVVRGVRAGTFPPPRKLSVRRCAWLPSDVAGWLESRPTARGGDAAR